MSLTQVIIRQAKFSDLESLISLLKVLFSIEEDFVFNEILQHRGLEMMISDERACILVAEINDEVIGMCSGQLTISTAEGGPSLLVEDVVVLDDFTRQGIGTSLLEKIGSWAQTQGAKRLQLLADENNEQAFEFYKKLGWNKTQLVCLRKRLANEGAVL